MERIKSLMNHFEDICNNYNAKSQIVQIVESIKFTWFLWFVVVTLHTNPDLRRAPRNMKQK